VVLSAPAMGDRTPDKPDTTSRLADTLRTHADIVEILLSAAHRHMRNTADAEDLLQETLRIALERDGPPDPDDPVAVRLFLGSIMNSRAANRRRAEHRHPTTPYDERVTPGNERVTPGDDQGPPIDEANHSITLSASIPNPERAMIEREEEAFRQATKAALRDALAGDDIAQRMFDLADTGVRGSTEFAERIGCSRDDVYRAQRRITRHAQRLAAHRAEHTKRAS
jgi:DNA-directed RNA polymerase specialized sigma24 family protein